MKHDLKIGKSIAAAVMLLAVLTLNIAPYAHALDVQALPENTRAATGFTHVMKLAASDLTNSTIYSQFRFYPRTGNAAVGDVVDRAAVYLVTPFYVTNANGGSNAVFINVGTQAVTNQLISNFPAGSNQTQLAFVSNSLAPAIFSAATSSVICSITFSNASMTTNLNSGAGEAHIYLRVAPFDKLRGF
jgi:hypothetical protein